MSKKRIVIVIVSIGIIIASIVAIGRNINNDNDNIEITHEITHEQFTWDSITGERFYRNGKEVMSIYGVNYDSEYWGTYELHTTTGQERNVVVRVEFDSDGVPVVMVYPDEFPE